MGTTTSPSSDATCSASRERIRSPAWPNSTHAPLRPEPGGTTPAPRRKSWALCCGPPLGESVADYLHDRIWGAIGTEADASWAMDGTGQEATFCCFNATLRDYARLGRLLAYDGAWEGRQLIPQQWVLDATTVPPASGYLAPGAATPYFGYGYQVWILPGAQRRFALLGLRGQVIPVDPASKLVMVHTAVRKNTSDRASNAETIALWLGVVEQFGK